MSALPKTNKSFSKKGQQPSLSLDEQSTTVADNAYSCYFTDCPWDHDKEKAMNLDLVENLVGPSVTFVLTPDDPFR